MTAPKVATRESLDTLTPERSAEGIAALAEEYRKDWGAIIVGLALELGLSYDHVMHYLLVREMAIVRSSFLAFGDILDKSRQPVYHDDCAGCREAKRFHELQLEMMELTIRHLKEEHGDEWKGEA